MIVLIPAYEPNQNLTSVVAALRVEAPTLTILVVDDGSGPSYGRVFDEARKAGAEVIGYPVNRGKGHALRSGLRYIQAAWPDEAVVCADSDGQHCTADILRIVDALQHSDGSMVLGGRRFSGDVPLRSRFGNSVARRAFKLTTGLSIDDTQTGLRGFPPAMIDWLLQVKGERFEYELNMLLESSAAGQRITELAVATIYLEQNESSHFRPIVDSLRVMRPLITYGAASALSFVVDIVALQLLFWLTGSLLAAVVGARVVSGSLNFLLNRHLVFRSAESRDATRKTAKKDATRYVVLAAALLGSSYLVLSALTSVGLALIPAKLITDVSLYVISFQVQRRFVFTRPTESATLRVSAPKTRGELLRSRQ